jgi:CRP-like cAMP-binding protein
MSGKPRSLAGIEILEWLPSAALATLEARCRWKEYTVDEQIIDQGSDNRDVFFVVDGGVRVVNYSTTGREIAYANLGSDAYFGEIAAIDGLPRSAAVVAIKPSMIASMASEIFLDLLFERPPVALKVLRKLCGVVRVCDDRIMDLSTLRAVQRVHIEVLRLAKAGSDGIPVIDPLPGFSTVPSRSGCRILRIPLFRV